METGRPPPRPPDTLQFSNSEQLQTVSNMIMHSGAENASDPPSNGEDLQNIPNPGVSAVTFEVANYANALRFLVDLLKNMKAVDPLLLKLIPQLEAKREVVAFDDPMDIPPNVPPNIFVNNYFGGLHVTQKAMIGKF
jgi:hypothetical protein